MEGKRVKKIISILALLAILAMPIVTSANPLPYSDITSGHAHNAGISWVTEKGIEGYPDGTYRANEPLSREHAARFFTIVMDLPLLEKSEVTRFFDDVSREHLYANYIATVGWAKIFTGNEGNFNPDNILTREQMATVLVNAYNLKSNGEDVPVRLDNVSNSHKKNVQIIANLNITDQLDNFKPAEAVTRGQFATFLHRSYMHTQNESDLEEIEPEPQPDPKPEQPPVEDEKYIVQTKKYNVNFSEVVRKQMTVAPQTDSSWVWYNAGDALTAYYLNANNFEKDEPGFYQFLKLNEPAGLNANEVNQNILNGKGILEGTGESFIEASKKYGVNEIYLIVHALLETGNGNSQLSNGIKVNGKTVYNMFGIGAIDICPVECGSERAYNEGWFSPEEAIIGGARFVSENYFSRGQDTLYKMRWNPDGFISNKNIPTHQYATDVGWATKQANAIYRFYQELNDFTLLFEVPAYNNQPAKTSRPNGEAEFAVDTSNQGDRYATTANLNVRSAPSTAYSIVTTLPKGTQVEVVGQNTGWFKIKANGHTGWVSSSYLK